MGICLFWKDQVLLTAVSCYFLKQAGYVSAGQIQTPDMVTNTTRYDEKAQSSLESMQQNWLSNIPVGSEPFSCYWQDAFSWQCSSDIQRRISFLSPEISPGGGSQSIN